MWAGPAGMWLFLVACGCLDKKNEWKLKSSWARIEACTMKKADVHRIGMSDMLEDMAK